MVSPLALVSVWAALKLKLIEWRHLCIWIALLEVRTWRDTLEPAQRNLFRFTPKRVAQALGNKRAGPLHRQGLADLERLGLARLTPTAISFTTSLDNLPAGLRAETEGILKSLGNANIARPIQMPRRLLRLIMKSRARPLRAAVLFAMLLRVMPVKRYKWYKGCLSTALLIEVSGFSESRIKRDRAALVSEGCFERLDTPVRVRQQHGDWYSLGRDLPMPSASKRAANRRPPTTQSEEKRRPPIKKPTPSFGIETNQLHQTRPGASRSNSDSKATEVPSWNRIVPEDLRASRRRTLLYEDACRRGVTGGSLPEKLTFYAAMARARRLGSVNPCGMLRRIVETRAYHRHITDSDEAQARAWLAEDQPQDLHPRDARNLLHRLMEISNDPDRMDHAKDNQAGTSLNIEPQPTDHAEDAALVSYYTNRLLQAGLPTHNAFNLIMTTHEGKTHLAGWTRHRWDRASATPDSDGPGRDAASHSRARSTTGRDNTPFFASNRRQT